MTYQPKIVKRESVITSAAQEIWRLVEVERLSPGDQLPTETSLSKMLGVSRNSVREALLILQGLGHIEKLTGRRSVISSRSPGNIEAIDENAMIEAFPIVIGVRSYISEKSVGLAAKIISAAELAGLTTALDELDDAIAQKDASAARTAHSRFHRGCIHGAHNELLIEMFDHARVDLPPNFLQEIKSFYLPSQLALHRVIVEELTRRDGVAASHAMRMHYENLSSIFDLDARARRRKSTDRGHRS